MMLNIKAEVSLEGAGVVLAKDSYRNGQKTPTMIFENLKPVTSH